MVRPGRRSLSLVLLVVLAVVATAGCGPVPADPEAGTGPTAPSALANVDDGERWAVVRLSLARPPSLLPTEVDPTDQAAVIVSDLLYDGLTEAVGLEGRLRPALALEWWPSDGFRVWDFALDPNRIEADVVASYLADRGDSVGLVESVEVRDRHAVRFVLTEPNAGFPWLLSGLALSIVDEEGGEPTGRYAIASSEASSLILTASDRPDVEIAWTESDDDAYRRLTLGLADGAVAPRWRQTDAASRFGSSPSTLATVRYLTLSPTSAALADDRVRQAVAAAIDPEALAGEGTVAVAGLLAPSLAGYRHSPAPTLATVAAPGDSVIRLATDRPRAELAAAVADALGAAGIPVELVAPADPADLALVEWPSPTGSVDGLPTAPGVGIEVDERLAEARATADDRARWRLLAEVHDQVLDQGWLIPLTADRSRFVAVPDLGLLTVRADGSLDIEPSR